MLDWNDFLDTIYWGVVIFIIVDGVIFNHQFLDLTIYTSEVDELTNRDTRIYIFHPFHGFRI
jgi:hypothetical protein